ncbi:hypothetical protein [Streptomyces sp. SP17BM10]|nr:hypothetical protein [Streptomyces sp. SP17BM10]
MFRAGRFPFALAGGVGAVRDVAQPVIGRAFAVHRLREQAARPPVAQR